jgi:plastocyanin
MLKTLFSTLLMFGLVAACSPSAGTPSPEEHVIVLKEGLLTVDGEQGMQFSIEASVGDVLHIFHSDPDFSHEFYITDEKYGMDVGNIVEIGDHLDIMLDHPGTFEIVCSRMEDMIITVNVRA